MTILRDSDKMITSNIYASGFAYYNKPMKKSTMFAISMIDRSLPEFRKLLNIPKDIKFRVAPLKTRGLHGCYWKGSKVAEIDPRVSSKALLGVIAHELVHAEQYNEGRLDQEYVRGRYVHSWNGSLVMNKGTTYAAYRNQPWEIEAFERQGVLADTVANKLGIVLSAI